MLDGFYFVKGDGSTQYSNSFSRQALNAIFNAMAVQKVGPSPSLTITVDHKNHDDTVWATIATFGVITTASATVVNSIVGTGIKEEVRFSFTLTATNQWEGFLIRMLAPGWFN
jgi:hypothetical protein